MSLEIQITGVNGESEVREAHVHVVDEKHAGLVVATHPMREYSGSSTFFANDSLGVDMNQAVSFGSIATVIHNGGTTTAADSGTADTDTLNHIIEGGQNFDTTCAIGMYATSSGGNGHITSILAADLTCDDDVCPNGNEAYTIDPVWAGTANQGAWNFADSGKITITSANNNDQATFDAGSSAAYDLSNYTAFTGKVDLDTYNPARNTIIIQFNLNSTPVGNSVLLDNYISTGDFAEQNFVIPFEDLGIVDEVVNELVITITRSGGTRPTIKFDDLQLETSGTPLAFTAAPPYNEWWRLTEIRFIMADLMDGTVTDGTMPSLAYNALLGVSQLGVGINLTISSGGSIVLQRTFRQMFDFMQYPTTEISSYDDGTNVWAVIDVKFESPVILKGEFQDVFTLTINDDLSGLLEFRASLEASVDDRSL